MSESKKLSIRKEQKTKNITSLKQTVFEDNVVCFEFYRFLIVIGQNF